MSHANDQSGRIVHEIRWSEALPWWILFRAAGAAFSPTVVLLASLGALATWAGWSVADRMRLEAIDPATEAILAAQNEGGSPGPIIPGLSAGVLPGRFSARSIAPSDRALPVLGTLIDALPPAAADAVRDFKRLVTLPFDPSATVRQLGGALARIGWFVLVWSIFGTAITRHVALRLVGEEAPGLPGSIWYGSRKWLASFNSVLFVLLGIAALSVPGCLLGVAMRTEWGLAVAATIWPLVLAGAIVLAILAVGVVAGWPLMVAAVGVERGDSFQAISTAFSYLYQRPLHYAFYAAVALALLLPVLATAGVFADATSTLALWAASFGMGHDRTAAVIDGLRTAGGDGSGGWSLRALAFWARGLEWLLGSFGWGYFWAIATAAYMLLRRDVDGTELDEVVVDEPAGEAA